MDFMTAYATAGHISNLLKEVVGIDKAVNAAEFKIKIADLSAAVSDLKLALIEAKDELAAKDAEIERLQKLLLRKAELIEHGGFSYDSSNDR
jgi:hypothetical protein